MRRNSTSSSTKRRLVGGAVVVEVVAHAGSVAGAAHRARVARCRTVRMAHVGRSLGVVVVGWASGFLIAIAWGATRANNPRLASILSGWAIAGMAVTGLLLLSIALSDRGERRRAARESQQRAASAEAAEAAATAERRSAARIAALEARLAREQEELDATVASLAAAQLAATGHVNAGLVEAVPDADRRRARAGAAPRGPRDCRCARRPSAKPCRPPRSAGKLEAMLEKVR